MKRLIIYTGLAAIAMTACQTKEEFKLVSSEMPQELNGKYVYVLDENYETIDSVMVENQAITYTASIDTVRPHYLSVNGQELFFVAEPSVVTIKEGNKPNTYAVEGGRLTELYKECTAALEKIYAPVNEKLQAIRSDSTKNEEEKASQTMQLVKDAQTELKKVATDYYTQNKENVIGFVAFAQIPTDTDEEFFAMYEAAPSHIQSNKVLKNRYEMGQTARNTNVGKQYADFTVTLPDSTTKKLSEYVGNGNYLLVDFWASWCGPCRKAMTHLADLNKRYAAKGLRVLSIGVNDKPEANAKAKEELAMTWETALDADGEGSKAYGIQAIPTLILISPEGEILARSSDPAEVTAKIEEVLKK